MKKFFLILLGVVTTACASVTTVLPSPSPVLPTSTFTRVPATQIATRTLTPTFTASPTLQPTSTATPWPTLPPSPTACPPRQNLEPCQIQGFKPFLQLGSGTIYQIALNPKGQLLAAASGRGVTVYDALSLKTKQAYLDPVTPAQTVAWSPDGRWLAAGLVTGIVQIWDGETLQPHLQLNGHRQSITSLAWSSDSSQLASAGLDAEIKIWDIAEAQDILTISDYGEAIRAIAWAPQGDWLAYGGETNPLVVRELTTEKVVKEIAPDWPLVALGWSPDGKHLAVQDRYALRLWERGSQTFNKDFAMEVASAFAWAPTSEQILVGFRGDVITYGETVVLGVDGSRTTSLLGHYRAVQAVISAVWNRDGSRLYTVDDFGVIEVFDAVTGKPLVERANQSTVRNIAWSWDSQWIAAASGNYVRVWSATDGGLLRTLKARYNILGGMDWSRDGAEIALASWEWRLGALEIMSGVRNEQIAGFESGDGIAFNLLYAPVPKTSLLAYNVAWGGPLVIVDTANLSAEPNYLFDDRSTDFIRPLSWSKDAAKLITLGETETTQQIDVWDIASQQLEFQESGNSAAWSPDASQLVIGQANGELIFIETVGWKQTSSLAVSQSPIAFVDWSGANGLVAFATETGRIEIWDVSSGQQLAILNGHSQPLTELAWAPDGKRLASASLDGTVIVWGVR